MYILMIVSSKENRREKDGGKQRRLLNTLQDMYDPRKTALDSVTYSEYEKPKA